MLKRERVCVIGEKRDRERTREGERVCVMGEKRDKERTREGERVCVMGKGETRKEYVKEKIEKDEMENN